MKFEDKKLMLAAAFVAGLLVGWFVLGWLLFPVHWTNVNPWEMRPSARATYLDLVAQDYAIHHDKGRLNALLMGWPRDDLAESLPKLITYYQQHGQTARARAVSEMMSALGPDVAHTERRGSSPLWKWLWLLLKVLLLTLFFTGVLYVLWYLKRRLSAPPTAVKRERHAEERPAAAPVIPPETVTEGGSPAPEPVIVTAPASPKPGMELLERATLEFHVGEEADYTDIKTLTTEEGSEYLGEFSLGPEAWLDDRHELPYAFSIWLFDKQDVNSKSVFLVSPGAWNDERLRSELTRKPDGANAGLVKIAPGASFALETNALYLQGIVSSVSYSPKSEPDSVVAELKVKVEVYRNPENRVPSFLARTRK